jgi:hypothetical protein
MSRTTPLRLALEKNDSRRERRLLTDDAYRAGGGKLRRVLTIPKSAAPRVGVNIPMHVVVDYYHLAPSISLGMSWLITTILLR